LDPKKLWYVPDHRIRTKSASARAMKIAKWIQSGIGLDEEPNEALIFVGLHTCAYRAARRNGCIHISIAERSNWADRWQTIREYLVEKNLGLAYTMVGRFKSPHLDENELLSDALHALIRAVDRFNPWKGFRFSTYACNVIVRALIRCIKREGRHQELFPVNNDVSFEIPTDMPDSRMALYVERLNRVMGRNLGALTELESVVLSRRFFPDQGTKLTFQEIGNSIGLSKERVRQIQNVALRKLRIALNEDPVLQ
jgi:RNA polymerase sigma factor (sigma-70 family)